MLGVEAVSAAPSPKPTPPSTASSPTPHADSYIPAPPLPIEETSPKVKADFDAHLARVKEEIRINGGQIVGEKKATYEPAPEKDTGKKGGELSTMSFPSGCGLYLIVYFNYHSGTYSDVVGSSMTSCTYSVYYIGMDSVLNKYDTFWLWWDDVDWDSNGAYWVSSLTTTTNFLCTTGNYSGFSGSTSGQLYSGGTRYTAAVYDGDYYWNCGN
jgi:hypothetical protein